MKWDYLIVPLYDYFDHMYCIPRGVQNYFRNVMLLLVETSIQHKPQLIFAKTISMAFKVSKLDHSKICTYTCFGL